MDSDSVTCSRITAAILLAIGVCQAHSIADDDAPQRLLSIRYLGKHGFIDREGNIIIEPKFEDYRGFDSHRGFSPVLLEDPQYSEGYRPAKLDGKWGYINMRAEFLIDPRWDMAGPFRNGIAQVRLSDCWGIIEKTGEYLVEPQFSYIGPFIEGRARVAVDGNRIQGGMPGSKWGFIDDDWQMIAGPEYDYVWNYHNGRALVNIGGRWGGESGYDFSGGIWGVIDAAGRVVLEPQIEFALRLPLRLHPAHEDVLRTPPTDNRRPVSIDGRLGYVDGLWNIVIPPQFDSAGDFSEGLAAVERDGKFGYINVDGEFVIPPKYDAADAFGDGMAPVRTGGQLEYIDREGNNVFVLNADEGKPFANGIAFVRIGDVWGVIDRDGAYKHEPRFTYVYRLLDNFYHVEGRDRERGLLNKHGNLIVDLKYDWVGAYQLDGLAAVGDGLFSDNPILIRIDRKGHVVDSPEMLPFYPKKLGDKWGIVCSQSSEFVIEPEFENVKRLDECIIGMQREQRWGLIDLGTGEIIIEPKYYTIHEFSEGLAATRPVFRGPLGYIDKSGTIVIEPQFTYAGKFEDGIACVQVHEKESAFAPAYMNQYYIDTRGRFLWHPTLP